MRAALTIKDESDRRAGRRRKRSFVVPQDDSPSFSHRTRKSVGDRGRLWRSLSSSELLTANCQLTVKKNPAAEVSRRRGQNGSEFMKRTRSSLAHHSLNIKLSKHTRRCYAKIPKSLGQPVKCGVARVDQSNSCRELYRELKCCLSFDPRSGYAHFIHAPHF
jgi:hypothetical protein